MDLQQGGVLLQLCDIKSFFGLNDSSDTVLDIHLDIRSSVTGPHLFFFIKFDRVWTTTHSSDRKGGLCTRLSY